MFERIKERSELVVGSDEFRSLVKAHILNLYIRCNLEDALNEVEEKFGLSGWRLKKINVLAHKTAMKEVNDIQREGRETRFNFRNILG